MLFQKENVSGDRKDQKYFNVECLVLTAFYSVKHYPSIFYVPVHMSAYERKEVPLSF